VRGMFGRDFGKSGRACMGGGRLSAMGSKLEV
jgi:hypothetical protein